jgi:hypothetical protein
MKLQVLLRKKVPSLSENKKRFPKQVLGFTKNKKVLNLITKNVWAQMNLTYNKKKTKDFTLMWV